MTVREALMRLHAIQTWRRLPVTKDGLPYGPGFFATRRWLETLGDENRRVSVRLARISCCLACPTALGADSTGDHLMPLSRGGPVGAQNYVPLCRACNASKGAKDFLGWWQARGRSVTELPNDVVVAYARLRYQAELRAGDPDRAAEPTLAAAVMAFEPFLPPRHWDAVMQLGAR